MAEIIGIQPVGADSIVGTLTELLGHARMGEFSNMACVMVRPDGSIRVDVPAADSGVYELIGAIEQMKHDILAAKAAQGDG